MERGRSILVVDDDDDYRETLQDWLSFEGLSVSAVRHGAEALEWLRAHSETRWLVLLDLMMPVMDGRTFLAVKGQDHALAPIPVIVLTAGGDYRDLGPAQNVVRCFAKTVQLSELMEAIAACP